jgi:hypothetical protein
MQSLPQCHFSYVPRWLPASLPARHKRDSRERIEQIKSPDVKKKVQCFDIPKLFQFKIEEKSGNLFRCHSSSYFCSQSSHLIQQLTNKQHEQFLILPLLTLGVFLFTTASRTALVTTQPPIQWVQRALSLGVKATGA